MCKGENQIKIPIRNVQVYSNGSKVYKANQRENQIKIPIRNVQEMSIPNLDMIQTIHHKNVFQLQGQHFLLIMFHKTLLAALVGASDVSLYVSIV